MPFPSPGGLPNPGIEPEFPTLAAGFFAAEPSGKPSAEHSDLIFLYVSTSLRFLTVQRHYVISDHVPDTIYFFLILMWTTF